MKELDEIFSQSWKSLIGLVLLRAMSAYQRPYGHKRGLAPPAAPNNSRKNKLQRCSICGGLGHKSRTCPESSNGRESGHLVLEENRSLSWGEESIYSNGSWSDDNDSNEGDLSDVGAAYGLLTLAAAPPDFDVLSLATQQQQPAAFNSSAGVNQSPQSKHAPPSLMPPLNFYGGNPYMLPPMLPPSYLSSRPY